MIRDRLDGESETRRQRSCNKSPPIQVQNRLPLAAAPSHSKSTPNKNTTIVRWATRLCVEVDADAGGSARRDYAILTGTSATREGSLDNLLGELGIQVQAHRPDQIAIRNLSFLSALPKGESFGVRIPWVRLPRRRQISIPRSSRLNQVRPA